MSVCLCVYAFLFSFVSVLFQPNCVSKWITLQREDKIQFSSLYIFIIFWCFFFILPFACNYKRARECFFLCSFFYLFASLQNVWHTMAFVRCVFFLFFISFCASFCFVFFIVFSVFFSWILPFDSFHVQFILLTFLLYN